MHIQKTQKYKSNASQKYCAVILYVDTWIIQCKTQILCITESSFYVFLNVWLTIINLMNYNLIKHSGHA